MDIIWFLVIGLLAGLISSGIMGRRNSSIVMDLVLGVAGALVGNWLFRAVGFYAYGFVASLIAATVGAILVLWVVNLFTSNRGRIRR
jgi:uncharacterized membrane protein YeaQ/YmgE (transglycosylase-associated protein family)